MFQIGKTENLAQHVRNIQERETQEVDEKEVSISEKQKSDKDLTLIRKWVEKGEKPELKEITGESITVKSMWAQFDQLTIRRTKHKATSVCTYDKKKVFTVTLS